jgi:hypothetical protein
VHKRDEVNDLKLLISDCFDFDICDENKLVYLTILAHHTRLKCLLIGIATILLEKKHNLKL